jgi:HAE1 family hydrophobic/amphiphilic exporter-1
MALSLSVGLLIDDAIVVRENIVRHIALGADHHSALWKGTTEIGLAVLATTFSIVAVFLPVGFMGGIIGRFFHQFGLTGGRRGADLDVRLVHAGSDAVVDLARPAGRGQVQHSPLGRLLAWFHGFMERFRRLRAPARLEPRAPQDGAG